MTLEKRIARLEQARQSGQDYILNRTPDSVLEERLRQIEAYYLHNVPLPEHPKRKVSGPRLNMTPSSVIEERLRKLGVDKAESEKTGNEP